MSEPIIREAREGDLPDIRRIARAAWEPAVILTGGCFQNAALATLASARLAAAGFRVVRHRRVPPNDGGLAVGQALAAARGRWS